MAEAHAKPQHDYHLVNPSPWPVVGGVGALHARDWRDYVFRLEEGRHAASLVRASRASSIVIFTMFGWWRDVIKEAHEGYETPVVQLHLRYGMILFIASEVMFFVAWFWAYFDAALYPDDAVTYARTAGARRAMAADPERRHRCRRVLAGSLTPSIPGACRSSTR